MRDFHTDPTQEQQLKESSLCLQLTGIATSLSAREPSAQDLRPAILRLATGEVQQKVSQRLCEILRLLRNDDKLQLEGTIMRLWTTGSDILIRFDMHPGIL